MPVAMATADDDAHESHEVEGLAFNVGQRALRHVRAHTIRERMGNHKVLHTAAACCELFAWESGEINDALNMTANVLILIPCSLSSKIHCSRASSIAFHLLTGPVNAAFFFNLRILSR